ncbi:peptide ABC transporter substrate-binding protein [Anaerotruncus rubiinfantis]|uniref:peptide ABC transporter substrate-binding protein n=1 Tax=Anaerotruncus rubiinfantis TaxID=1720200 RepID=UPI0034A35CF5
MTKNRLLALLLAAVFLFAFSGCGDKTADQIFKYDIPSGVHNLDPQFATDSTARMIIQNTFEGLFRQLPSGEIEPCLAESYEVSADGLTYTFHLRRDAAWGNAKLPRAVREAYNGTPVTAHDFVFALSRMFNPTAPSPFAGSFSSIKNAELIRRGAAPMDSLGVRATDDYTLEITLIRQDSLLPELLAASYAMPCNEDFFRSTKARYGLDLKSLLFNGPFGVTSWDNESGVTLRQNAFYSSPDPVIAGGVNLYIQPGSPEAPADPVGRFLAGSTDACKVNYGALPAVLGADGAYESFEDVVWVLAFNCRDEALANAEIRRALAYAIDRKLFDQYLPENLRVSEMLVPPAVSLLGESFRTFAGENSELLYSPHLAKQNFASGLEDLGLEKIPLSEILVPDTYNLPLLTGFVQQGWQKNLAVYTGLVKLSEAELLARVASGNYSAAILPLSASYSSPGAVLADFSSASTQNLTGYGNADFDTLLAATASLSGQEAYEVYAQAEEMLLYDAPVIPLFFETSYYAMGPDVSGIEFSPFLSGVYFKYARKK